MIRNAPAAAATTPTGTPSYDKAKDLLYVLTGQKPFYSERTITENVLGPHLRFAFDDEPAFHKTRLILKIFNIGFNEIYSPSMQKQCMTVAPEEFDKISLIFDPAKLVGFSFKFDNLFDAEKLILANLLFSKQEKINLKERNRETFPDSRLNMEGVFIHHWELLIANAVSVKFLHNQGYVFQHGMTAEDHEKKRAKRAATYTPSYSGDHTAQKNAESSDEREVKHEDKKTRPAKK